MARAETVAYAATFLAPTAMAITFASRQDAASDTTPSQASTPATPNKKPKATHTKRRPYDRANLLKPGRLKTGEMLDLYGVSHSTFYVYKSKGLVPQPDGHIMGRPYWLTATIAPHFTQAKG